jgi:hypothetical protein
LPDALWKYRQERGGAITSVDFICYEGFDALPAAYEAAFGARWESDFFSSPAWFRYLVRYFFPDRQEFRLWAAEEAGRPLMLFPVRRTQLQPNTLGALSLLSASHWENSVPLCLLFAEGVDREALLTAFFRYLRSEQPYGEEGPFDTVRVWPLDPGGEEAGIVRRALRRAGFWVQPYKNSVNRHETLSEPGYAAYFEKRSYNFRYHVRRRRRQLEREHKLQFDLYTTPDNLDRGITDYREVAAASWKKPVSMVGPVHIDFIRAAIAAGAGRLGIMLLDRRPVSTQFWVVADGEAHCVRLAYDEALSKKSVGIVHTDEMIRHVLDADGAQRLNYGYGNEDYKAKWMKEMRIMHGVMAYNPATKWGRRYGLKSIVGSSLKQWLVVKPISAWLERRERDRKPRSVRRR